MSSGLTKHYYVIDEVKVALAYACKERKHEEAYFWCKELVVSHMAYLAREVLFDTWFWTYGSCKLFWLECVKHCDLDKLPRLAQILANIEKDAQDSSLWVILKETKEQPDRIIGFSDISGYDANSLESYFLASASEHKAACAWWAASQLGIDATLALATKLRPERACWLNSIALIELSGYDTAIHCVISCVASMWDSIWINSIKPIQLPKVIEPKIHKGPREARQYAIQQIYLYGHTERGRIKQSESTLSNLRCIENNLKGPYWDAKLKEIKATRGIDGKIVWASEDSFQEFYEKYFPDDIPDEWSLADQIKSHGNGVLGETEQLSQEKLLRIWLPRRQRLCWFQITNDDDGILEPLAAMALEDSPVASSSDILDPVKKIYKVIS